MQTPMTKAAGIVGTVLFAAVGPACSPREDEAATPDPPVPERSIEAVLADRTEGWMAVPGVTGTGIGLCDEDPCLVVFVARDTGAVRRRIPEITEGYAVDLRVSGTFRARDSL